MRSEYYCASCREPAPTDLEGGPGHTYKTMKLRDFPHRTYADVRHRIIQQNIQPSGAILVSRIRAVAQAKQARDSQALRGALEDLAATAIQAAAHKEVLKIMGESPPVIPTRQGRV